MLVFRLGSTQYHLCVCWSAPRNFYTHANVLAAGITCGPPVQMEQEGARAFFNRMYYAKDKDLRRVLDRLNYVVHISMCTLIRIVR